jgi:hypothetical protein
MFTAYIGHALNIGFTITGSLDSTKLNGYEVKLPLE